MGVVIGDTCGRGAEAEVQLARILPRLHELSSSGASPAELLSQLNETVARELPTDRFVTAAAFEFDVEARVLTVANAAHVPAMIRRVGGREVCIVGHASGMPLGIARDTRYTDERHELNEGDLIVLMTDGMLEAVESDLLTMSTLRSLLAVATGGAACAHGFLLQRFEECTAGRRVDDMTLMALMAVPDASEDPHASMPPGTQPS